MEYLLENPENPDAGLGGPKDQHQHACLTTVFKLLHADSPDFQKAFADQGSFENEFSCLKAAVMELVEKRRAVYERDAKTTIANLSSIQKKVPEVDPESLGPFVSCVKTHQKKLLESTDLAAEIVGAIAQDSSAFGCDPKKLCEDLKSHQHMAMTTLAEQSAAVLLQMDDAKKYLSTGQVLPKGRLRGLFENLSTTSREKGLHMNATLQAQVTSLLAQPAEAGEDDAAA
eukprot:s1547_g14.t1